MSPRWRWLTPETEMSVCSLRVLLIVPLPEPGAAARRRSLPSNISYVAKSGHREQSREQPRKQPQRQNRCMESHREQPETREP
jgi:hypothetical protein